MFDLIQLADAAFLACFSFTPFIRSTAGIILPFSERKVAASQEHGGQKNQSQAVLTARALCPGILVY